MNLSCAFSRQQNEGNSKNVQKTFTERLSATANAMIYLNAYVRADTGPSSQASHSFFVQREAMTRRRFLMGMLQSEDDGSPVMPLKVKKRKNVAF